MRKILIQNHYWKLFWSLIPKLVLFFFYVEHKKYLYRVLKCINLTFGYPKDSGSGAQHKNPRPNLEAVTKTDSNNQGCQPADESGFCGIRSKTGGFCGFLAYFSSG